MTHEGQESPLVKNNYLLVQQVIEQLQLRHENTWQSTSVWQEKYCAQWQLKGSRCLTHDLCAIFVGFTQRD